MDHSSTFQAVRGWPVDEQFEFVFQLWDQLVEDGWQPVPTDDLAAELDRRLVEHEANPDDLRSSRGWRKRS
jgi:putative addiction module component (TIGR02574 family)